MAKKQQNKGTPKPDEAKNVEVLYDIVVKNFGMGVVNFNARIGSTRYSKNILYMDTLLIELGKPSKEIDEMIEALRVRSFNNNVKIDKYQCQTHTHH
jgi:hypothetical protein